MSTVTDEGLFAALSAGIDGDAPPPEETTDEEADTTGADDDATGDETGTGEGGDDAAGDGTGGEQSGDGDDDAAGAEGGEAGGADASGRERDPVTGKFVAKKKDDKETPEGDGGALGPDGKPVAKQPATGKDPVNDPIPQGLKKETQERMVALVNTAKTLTQERDHFKAAYQEHIQYIQESRATPEQYSQAIEYIGWANSGDPAKIQKCIQFMQTELAALSKLAGVPVAGVDVLAEHADLKQKVADGALSLEDAQELAALRSSRALRTVHAQHTQEQNAAAERAQQERQQCMADLNNLEQELLANDPLYKTKRPAIIQALQAKNPTTGKSLIESTHPTQWTALFLRHYALAKAPAHRPQPGAQGSSIPRNQPLRARQPAGGQAAAPKSMLDALNAGLADAG